MYTFDIALQFPKGAILVFLPGFAEIQQLYEALQTHRLFGNRNKARYVIQCSFILYLILIVTSVLHWRGFNIAWCKLGMQYCKRGYFRWGGGISRKCWQNISRGGNFHETTPISFINAYGFYFRVGVILVKKTKARKKRKFPPRENFHIYSIWNILHFLLIKPSYLIFSYCPFNKGNAKQCIRAQSNFMTCVFYIFRFKVIPLHSTLSSEDQHAVFL